MSAKDRLQSTVDEGMPAQAVANWVQCENPKCLKWRKLPWHVDVDLLPETFYCKDNVWNPKSQDCEAEEDEWDMDDAPIKFDTNVEQFEVGGAYCFACVMSIIDWISFSNLTLLSFFALQRGLTSNAMARWDTTKRRLSNSTSNPT